MGITMKVVSINERTENKLEEIRAQQKESALNILEDMRQRVEDGEIIEFVAASTDEAGQVQIHCSIKDYVGGLGMFEMGKYTLTVIAAGDDYDEE